MTIREAKGMIGWRLNGISRCWELHAPTLTLLPNGEIVVLRKFEQIGGVRTNGDNGYRWWAIATNVNENREGIATTCEEAQQAVINFLSEKGNLL